MSDVKVSYAEQHAAAVASLGEVQARIAADYPADKAAEWSDVAELAQVALKLKELAAWLRGAP